MPTVASSSLMVSSNPVRMAQFSYQLVTGCISDIIPLSIRIQRNNRDTDAVRELVTLFMNRLYQARDAYYQSVTIGVLQVSIHYDKFCTLKPNFNTFLHCCVLVFRIQRFLNVYSAFTGLQWVISDNWVR
jgi:hypothetical protein